MITQAQADGLALQLGASEHRGFVFRGHAMAILHDLPSYDWCGIYRLEGDALVLDAYVGAETDHIRIPVGRGVCGTAVAENRNQVVGDVRELSNYLACSAKTRSEIVVLIRKGTAILGQIDIDGHSVNAFDHTDEALLERFAGVISDRWV